MKFEMVGTGSAFGEGLNSSGYLVLSDMLIIIDLTTSITPDKDF